MSLHRPHRPSLTNAIARILRARFTGLTIVVVTLSLAAGVIPNAALREIAVDIAFSALFLFAIWSTRGRERILTAVLAIPAAVGHWSLRLGNEVPLRILVFSLSTIFLAYLTLVVILTVLRDESITSDTIVGALCAYFLLGVTFGTAYALLAVLSPDAFQVAPALAATSNWGTPSHIVAPLLQYYSFTTLATLGMGDVSPLTPGARTLTVIEGMTGQLYITVLISRLVGMHSSHVGK